MEDKCKTIADETRDRLEEWCEEHDGDMMDFFTDSIYGVREDGGLIVGYGVYGSANVVVGVDRAECGGRPSADFSAELKEAMRNFFETMENC